MNITKRIEKAVENALKLKLGQESRYVLMSDCHRGDGSHADNFAKNQNLYYVALRHYYREGFTYIELGDGDELWENRKFEYITREYHHVFDMLATFHHERRLYMVYGNHDIAKRNEKWIKYNLYAYLDNHEHKMVSLFPGIRTYESVLLYDGAQEKSILLLHGHQADCLNDRLWRLSRFLVRHLWRPLELMGMHDPFSASKNPDKRKKVEQNLMHWVKKHKQIMIAGHTHRPIFPQPGELPYFNDGSSVHPRCITALEITRGEILLIKWSVQTKDDGMLYVAREVLEGPVRLAAYY